MNVMITIKMVITFKIKPFSPSIFNKSFKFF